MTIKISDSEISNKTRKFDEVTYFGKSFLLKKTILMTIKISDSYMEHLWTPIFPTLLSKLRSSTLMIVSFRPTNRRCSFDYVTLAVHLSL